MGAAWPYESDMASDSEVSARTWEVYQKAISTLDSKLNYTWLRFQRFYSYTRPIWHPALPTLGSHFIFSKKLIRELAPMVLQRKGAYCNLTLRYFKPSQTSPLLARI